MRRLSCESGREEREDAVHAVVGQVKIDTTREEEAKKLLDEMVLPTSKAMAGFPRRLLVTSARLGQRALVAVVRFRGERSSRRRADGRGSAAGRADDLGECDGVRSRRAGVARQLHARKVSRPNPDPRDDRSIGPMRSSTTRRADGKHCYSLILACANTRTSMTRSLVGSEDSAL